MIFDGFVFSGYRSIGNELVKIAPLKKINFIIGQNNSGKSNVINFIYKHYYDVLSKISTSRNSSISTEEDVYSELDIPLNTENRIRKIGFFISKEKIEEFIKSKNPNNSYDITRYLSKLLNSSFFLHEDGNYWFIYKYNESSKTYYLDVDIHEIEPMLKGHEWSQLWNVLTKQRSGDLIKHWIPETLNSIQPPKPEKFKIELIPAIREIGEKGTISSDFSGKGIIDRLAKIQNPSHFEQDKKEKFNKINYFVKEVLENETSTIEIPFERDMILVHMDGKTLPLNSLGTGVHEVIIFAAAATILENTLICIEEPELHLHPLLQNKLIKYLNDKTNNQYFFTTHSAHLLDSVEAEIFHVTQENNVSKVSAISSTKERSRICNDLGYKASDILQSNCIIWVEGPSDRIYLNNWLSNYNSKIIEGIHYSIMFYGGRLFSHLSAMDKDELKENIDDLISLRNLNRNSIIIFDSDKEKSTSTLTATKKRLRKEFNDGEGFSWVTNGREIENYIDSDIIEECVKTVHPSAKNIISKGQWANLLKYKNKKDERTASKVKVAKYYIENYDIDIKVLDLEKQLKKLSDFILSVNGIK